MRMPSGQVCYGYIWTVYNRLHMKAKKRDEWCGGAETNSHQVYQTSRAKTGGKEDQPDVRSCSSRAYSTRARKPKCKIQLVCIMKFISVHLLPLNTSFAPGTGFTSHSAA